jgi:ABC-2 type transport system ATP-binding protein
MSFPGQLGGTAIPDIIVTTDLTKSYNDFTAVDHISFSVRQGEIFGFLGPNGAGKTTTIKMLTTLQRPTSGNALICGHDIRRERNQVRQQIGVVFQEPALETQLTGEENLDFHARVYGLHKEQRQKRIHDVLTLVDLVEKKDILVKNYSGGMKRRLEIARGLMHSPTILFLDEPTLGLDAQTRRAIWDYIRKMNKEENTTIFLTTHYMDEADTLCDRIGIIDHGHILILDTVDSLKTSIGDDVISLTCSNLPALQTKLKQQPWVKHDQTQGDNLSFGTSRGDEKIPLVLDIARASQITVHSITIRKPTLDDVFLHYTGRSIRTQDMESSMHAEKAAWRKNA